ncbi:MAG: amidase, partial [Bryobacteraceae bacterium]|nr:amidase [Bryobacteraceae bacterium]
MLERLTLTEMARLVAARQVSPRELVEAHLARIEETNPGINAFTSILAGQALRQARALEGRNPIGPLHGVPVTIKDQFDVEGAVTLAGSRLRLNEPPATRDATAVAHLRAAGAIILAKTNVPELVSSYETDNYVTGRTNHPLDPERTPGGSSGGEAAAIASFCSPGGLSSDGGGSIRIPAHFCGIVGFKPTHRAIGGGGMWPPPDAPAGLLTAPGPMARTAADVHLLFRVLAQPDPRDSQWVPTPATSPLRRRIGVMRQSGATPVDPAISAALAEAARQFTALGFQVEEFTPAGISRAPNVWAFFFGELSGNRRILEGREAEAHWTATEFLRDTPWPTAPAIQDAYTERERMRAAILAQMEPYAAILSPP